MWHEMYILQVFTFYFKDILVDKSYRSRVALMNFNQIQQYYNILAK